MPDFRTYVLHRAIAVALQYLVLLGHSVEVKRLSAIVTCDWIHVIDQIIHRFIVWSSTVGLLKELCARVYPDQNYVQALRMAETSTFVDDSKLSIVDGCANVSLYAC